MRLSLVPALLALASCSSAPAASKPRPLPLVTTLIVPAEDVRLTVRAPVEVRALAQADIGSKTVGVLEAVLVDRGDLVKKGQLLALIRTSDLPDQLAAAKGALAQAEVARQLAGANLERAQALATTGLISQQELQNATSARSATEAQAGSAQAQLAALATRLGETRLEAPYDGVITARRLDPGALVGPSAGSVLSVARVEVVRVFIAAPEKRAASLAVGQVARVQLDALAPEVLEGRVERLAPAFDPLTRTLDAEVHLPNPSRRLRPGMYGRGEVQVGVRLQRPVVPAEAVQIFEDRAFVFVVQGDAVARRAITLGEDLGARLEVLEGLEPGEEIVVRGVDAVTNGAAIRRGGAPDAGPVLPRR
jgi:RND family efflux transporter MFP subunit